MNSVKSGNSDHEIRLKAVLDTAVDAIICIDSHGIIDLFNYAAEKIQCCRSDWKKCQHFNAGTLCQ